MSAAPNESAPEPITQEAQPADAAVTDAPAPDNQSEAGSVEPASEAAALVEPAAEAVIEAAEQSAETVAFVAEHAVETAADAADHASDAVPALAEALPEPDEAAPTPAAEPAATSKGTRVGASFVFVPAFAPLNEINATLLAFARGEGEAALAHFQALSRAKSPADAIRLQVSELQRAADASLTCFSHILRSANRFGDAARWH